MAKQGMRRYDQDRQRPHKNKIDVPLIQGKAKHGNERANPIIAGTEGPSLMVYHSTPHSDKGKERPISSVYKAIDTDLARDNLENDMSKADILDLL